jgi:capsular polysaccharide biosynthesis protein
MQYEITAMLWRVAAKRGWQVRHFSATAAAPFSEHILAMSQTGLLVARHGPLLANGMFLPRGAAVYELLPYNWEWQGLSQLYRNLTASVGSLHHFAWRPQEPQWAVYASDADAKYSRETPPSASVSAHLHISRTTQIT